MSISLVIIVYVADKLVAQFIKEEGYSRVKQFLFPKNKYRVLLKDILIETIAEFEQSHPYDSSLGKIPFYTHKDTFEALSTYLLFSQKNKEIVIKNFSNNLNVIPPKIDEINDFYTLFRDKVHSDPKLKQLFIEENYKEEIYEISQELQSISEKISSVKSDTTQTLEKVEQNQKTLDLIKNKFGNLDITTQIILNDESTQPLVDKITYRVSLVSRLTNELQQNYWVALNGEVGYGKTQIAALLVNDLKYPLLWINLRGFTSSNFIIKIFYKICKSANSTETEFGPLLKRLPANSIIVLDDLPKIEKKIYLLFVGFLRACFENNIKVLSTSNYHITNKFLELVPGKVLSKEIPAMDETDTKEILIAYGCSDEKAELYKRFVQLTSSGHPTILVSICRYLMNKNWALEVGEIQAIFSNKFSSELTELTYSYLSDTIEDDDTKELLSRLNIINGSFTVNDVRVVSGVQPSIKLPIEKLQNLVGLWVQKETDTLFSLSPLLKQIGSENLSFDIETSINRELGENILSKERLDPHSAIKAITYFIKSNEYNKAGFILVLVLSESLKNSKLFFEWGFNLFWLNTSLPEEMDLILQMQIRVFQINILNDEDKDKFLINDLESIVGKASLAGINTAPAYMLLSYNYARVDTKKANTYLLKGLKDIQDLKTLSDTNLVENLPTENFIWVTAFGIKNEDDLSNWFDTVQTFTDKIKESLIHNEGYKISALKICSNLYRIELEKGLKANWTKLISILNSLIHKSKELGFTLFIANAVKQLIIIYFEHLNNTEEAYKIVALYSSAFVPYSTESFLINDTLGRQLFYKGDIEKSISYMLEAVSIDVDDFYTEKIDTWIVMSQLLGKEDNISAHHYVEKAQKFTLISEYSNELTKIKVNGEYAISFGLNKKYVEAIYELEKGYSILVDSYKDNDEYKATISRYGHVIYYYYLILEKGHPPTKTMDDQVYLPPYRGLFLKSNDNEMVQSHFFEERLIMVPYSLLKCFETIGDLPLAKKWANIMVSLSSKLTHMVFSTLIHDAIPYLIIDGKFNMAINVAKNMLSNINIDKNVLAKETSNKYLTTIIQNRPNIRIDGGNEIILELVIVPSLVIILAKENIEEKNRSINELIKQIKALTDEDYYVIIINILEKLKNVDNDYAELVNLCKGYTGQKQDTVKVIGYLTASISAPIRIALNLHMSLVGRVENHTMKISIGTYRFIVLPFFKNYWLTRYEAEREAFFDPIYFKTKGLEHYEKSKWDKKLRSWFRVICHHLEYGTSTQEQNWLDDIEDE